MLFSQDTKPKRFSFTGNLGLGYEYGLLPFVANAQPPQSNIFSDGYFNASFKDIPVNFNYFYSSVSSISGLNNYARFQFDSQTYKRQLKERVLAYKAEKLSQLGDIQSYKQKLQQQLNYLDLVEKGAIKSNSSSSFPAFPSNDKLPFKLSDLSDFGMSIDSPELPSLNNIDTSKFSGGNDLDSLPSIEDEIALRRDQLNKIIHVLGKAEEVYSRFKDASIDSLYNSPEVQKNMPSQSRLKRVLSHTDKFELGLCYPNNSVFTVNRTPLRGVNYEYSKNRRFFSFTHGTTINNLFIGTNVLQSNLNSARNLYNFFDFNNVSSGRRITSIKYGWGQKTGTHLFIGAMHGHGQTSYLDTISDSKEHNVVAELDGQIKLNKNHLLSIAYGRSYLQAEKINNSDQTVTQSTFFDLTERVNAGMLGYQGRFEKTKTDLIASIRYVDPFFKSLGLGFMRSDNFRYELRFKQKVKKNLKLSGFYRREQDNLLKLYDFNNYLSSFGLGAELKLRRSFFFKLDLRPVIHQLDAAVDSLAFTNQNFIINTVANYRKRIKKKHYLDITGVYAYYQLFNGESNNIYQNINVSANFSLSNKWLFSAVFNQYISSDTAIIPITGLIDFTSEYRGAKWSVKGGGKAAIPEDNGAPIQFGFIISGGLNLVKRTRLELSAERLVIGEFYNSLMFENVSAYPYNFKAILRINI